jgi:hypothetical protein
LVECSFDFAFPKLLAIYISVEISNGSFKKTLNLKATESNLNGTFWQKPTKSFEPDCKF